jgi:DNA (cytosine-5)-methyltransferase 1
MRAVELFAGAGGLAMGTTLAGFRSMAVVEWDRWACDTIRENQRRCFPLVADWPLVEGDVRDTDWSIVPTGIELVAGGPPCQPFSMGGKHRAHDDARDMFPAAVQVIKALRPKAFIVENVRGLTRSTFANYYQYILLQLEFPELEKRPREAWYEHLMRLQSVKTSGRRHGSSLTYNVVPTLINAADYGIAQKRERVFIVGFRSDLGVEWRFPAKTHSEDARLKDQWVSGSYWDRNEVGKRKRPKCPAKLRLRVKALAESPIPIDTKPWQTVREALHGLPDPCSRQARSIANHRLQPGARAYPGHTGSPLDLPAKTIKAGDHGVPGGENMMVVPGRGVRYFTVRETARLQSFPDGYVFHGSWSEVMRQLGNAVPVALARLVAASVAERLVACEASRLDETPAALRGVA